jgi:Asp/Glu/hydantoin racemase
MIYAVNRRSVSYGESIGILLLENFVPFIPGDTANATTYRYPVRFQRVPGLSVERIFSHDLSMYEIFKEKALSLYEEGVKAITGDCGFMALFQKQLAQDLDIPVFLSSLLQIPFMLSIIGQKDSITVITANSVALTDELLKGLNITDEMISRLHIVGLEDCEEFVEAVFDEKGTLDSDKIEKCVVQHSVQAKQDFPDTKAILLECSMLPPYAHSVAEATGLPVFDYITMIDYVHDAVIKHRFTGHM